MFEPPAAPKFACTRTGMCESGAELGSTDALLHVPTAPVTSTVDMQRGRWLSLHRPVSIPVPVPVPASASCVCLCISSIVSRTAPGRPHTPVPVPILVPVPVLILITNLELIIPASLYLVAGFPLLCLV